jgi:hypothetical protein
MPGDVHNLQGYERCICCNSGHLKEVNRRLQRGESYAKIVKFLETKDVSCSAPSVGRHKKNHLPTQIDPKEAPMTYQKMTKNANFIRKKTQVNNLSGKPKKVLQNTHKTMNADPPVDTSNSEALGVLISDIEKEFEQMKTDFDAPNEMLRLMAIAKGRVKKGLQQEADDGILINTVDKAINTTAMIIQKMKEILSGSENLVKLRQMQLQDMISRILGGGQLSEQTLFELSTMMIPESTGDQRVSNPIRPVS